MPTNLPPEYFEAEKRYKEASTPEKKAETLEELLKTIPKHKGTDKLRADYRRKLSKFKSQAQAKKKTGKHETHFHIEKEGDRRVIIIGAANVGKSSLVANLTHASPEISESPYSTWIPTPGMLVYEGVRLQLIDTPPIDRNYVEPEFLELIKKSDLILLMIDLQAYPIQQFQKAVDILSKNKIFSTHPKHETTEGQNWYLPMIIIANKDDTEGFEEDFYVLNELLREEGWTVLPISVKTGRKINEMVQFIIQELMMIRVYSKPPGKEADKTKPFVLKAGSTVEQFAEKVHHDFFKNLKSARVWGRDVHNGQMVCSDHILHDGDIVELQIK